MMDFPGSRCGGSDRYRWALGWDRMIPGKRCEQEAWNDKGYKEQDQATARKKRPLGGTNEFEIEAADLDLLSRFENNEGGLFSVVRYAVPGFGIIKMDPPVFGINKDAMFARNGGVGEDDIVILTATEGPSTGADRKPHSFSGTLQADQFQ